MAKEICLTIEDDGSFSVGIEDVQAESAETEPTGQKFNTLKEALSAVMQFAQSASIGGETMEAEETDAMAQSFRPGTTQR